MGVTFWGALKNTQSLSALALRVDSSPQFSIFSSMSSKELEALVVRDGGPNELEQKQKNSH